MNELVLTLALLACPLMMVFMMRGHGGAGHSHDHTTSDSHTTKSPVDHLGDAEHREKCSG